MAQSFAAKAKAVAQGISEIELKVQEATNQDPWGPHGALMGEIAQAAFDPEKYELIMGVIFQRLQESQENWRMCYKALLLIEFLLKRGPVRLAEDFRRDSSVLEKLKEFEYKDANGKDQGINVRNRAQEVLSLLANNDKLQAERDKSQKNQGKYTGVSSAEVRVGGTGVSPSSSVQNMGGTDGVQEEEDPFEATRKRIEKLKAEGALPDAPTTGPPSSLPEGTEPSKRQPKKLTDVKVNPQIAAVLCNFGSGSLLNSAGSGVSSSLSPSDTTAQSNPLDLLGDLDTSVAPSVPPAGGAQKLDWDAFAASATAPLAAPPAVANAGAAPHSDDWSGFASGIQEPQQKGPIDINSLLGAPGPVLGQKAPFLPVNTFSSPSPPLFNTGPAVGFGGASGGFAPGYGMPANSQIDPFAPLNSGLATNTWSNAPTSAVVAGAPAAVASIPKPKLGDPAANAVPKKKDPFADLTAF